MERIINMENVALGEFYPFLYRINLNLKFEEGGKKEFMSVYFHEYIHFVQSISTNYNIHLFFEMLDFINLTFKENTTLGKKVISGLSNLADYPSLQDFSHHLKLHQYSFDGRYKSYNSYAECKDNDSFSLPFNNDTLCYEYERYSYAQECRIATPLGAHTLQECFAALAQKNLFRGDTYNFENEMNSPPDSYLHYYSTPFEIFTRHFYGKNLEVNPIDLVHSLLATLELSLQMPKLDKMANLNASMPSWRFIVQFLSLNKIKFIDHRNDQDYFRFIDDLYIENPFLDPIPNLKDIEQNLSRIISSYEEEAKNYAKNNAYRYNLWVEEQCEYYKNLTEKNRSEYPDANDISFDMNPIKEILLSDPIAFSGVVGIGILRYIRTALRLRISDPLTLVFPHIYFEKLIKEIPYPGLNIFGKHRPFKLTADSYLFFLDTIKLNHLWGLTCQWNNGSRNGLICSNKYYNLYCNEKKFKSDCPKWNPYSISNHQDCTFVNILKDLGFLIPN